MATNLPRFGTDGVRGLANEELTPDVALALGRAASEVLLEGVERSTQEGGSGNSRRLVIGRDTRQSGHMLEAGLIAGCAASGVDVELLGVVPTPTVAWTAADQQIPGAMISASHNPFADNGIKLFAAGGRKLTDDVEARIQQRFHELLQTPGSDQLAGPTGAGVGQVVAGAGAFGWVAAVQASINGRSFDGLSVVLDCAHGSASALGPHVFEELGAKVAVIGNDPDGVNINAGVGSTHPELLQAAVVEAGAQIGLAFDGDADRLIAIDHAGNVVDGDHILAMLATDWRDQGKLAHDTIVVTVMSNLGFRLAMEAAGITVVETKVGDRYVLEALQAGSFSLGGEQSGHVICHDIASTGDGVLAGVQLLDLLQRSGRSLADLAADAMTTYPQVLKNVRLRRQEPDVADQLSDVVALAEAELGTQGRVLVRPSGTEPLVRIMVEHLDRDTAHRVCDELVAIAAERVGV